MLLNVKRIAKAMNWYLVFTKPRQENRAFENLQLQGFDCYLPKILTQTVTSGSFSHTPQPLFPRYLFVRLGQEQGDKSWSPIRSTKGVSRLVCFGQRPAKVDDALVAHLKEQEVLLQAHPQKRFTTGERVRLTASPFAGLEGVYQMDDGEYRVLVLIEFLSKTVQVPVSPSGLQKLA